MDVNYFNKRRFTARLLVCQFTLIFLWPMNLSLGQSETEIADHEIIPQEHIYKKINGENLALDIYSPNKGPDIPLLPTMVFFHGGGYTRGSKNDINRIDFFHDTLFPLIETHKMNVVSIDFRNAGENTSMPDIISDCKDALHWLGTQARDLGIDAQNIGLIGHSSGAHLALMSGLTKEDAFPNSQSSSGISYKISCIIGLSPPTDFLRQARESHEAGEIISQKIKNTVEHLFGGKYDAVPEPYKEASPINYLNKMSPPTFLLTGTKDKRLQNNSKWFKDAADKIEARVDLLVVEKAGHRIYRGGPDISPPLTELTRLIQQFIVDSFFPDEVKSSL